MDQNVGILDRLGRVVVAAAILFILVRSGRATMGAAMMLILSGSLLASAASGNCFLYTHLGISTSEKL